MLARKRKRNIGNPNRTKDIFNSSKAI
jgi:hypothetical protein